MVSMPEEGEQPHDSANHGETGTKSFDDLLADFAALKKEVNDRIEGSKVQTQINTPLSYWDRFNQFTSSGLFFMIVGVCFLFVAAWTLNTAHATFSFVLVVMGVAVLLFGTGTQGVGEAQAVGYKVAIAGGAGIIAFCVGWGMIHYADTIKTVFQVETKYIRVSLVGGDGSSNMKSYVAKFSIDGVGIPATHNDDSVEVLVPYLASDWQSRPDAASSLFAESQSHLFRECSAPKADASASADNKTTKDNEEYVIKTMMAHFYRVLSTDDLLKDFQDHVTIRLRKSAVVSYNSGLDFPLYPDNICVYSLSSQKAGNDLKTTGQAADIQLSTAKPIKPGVGPLLPAEGTQ